MSIKNTASNHVETFISKSRGAEYGFFKSAKQALENFEHKNNLDLYRMAAYTNGKKFGKFKADATGKRFNAPLKRILEKALPNVSLVFKEGKCAIKIDDPLDPALLANAIAALGMLAASKTTIKDKAFDDAFPKPETVALDWDAITWAERQMKSQPKQLEAMIAALQAHRSGLKVAA